MIRTATPTDAHQLSLLNDEFNGKGETTIENIQKSLSTNQQEIVIVDEENGILTGFVCVQLKKIILLRRIYARDYRGICCTRI